MTDIQLTRLVNRRLRELEKAGVDSNATRNLKENIYLFYQKHDLMKSGKYGTVLNKAKMSKREKTELRGIMRKFLKDPTSTKRGIKSEYKSLVDAREKLTGKKIKKYKSLGAMARILDKTKNILDAAKIQSEVPSDVVKNMWDMQKANDWDVDDVKQELLKIADSGASTYEDFNNLLNSSLKKLARKSGDLYDEEYEEF